MYEYNNRIRLNMSAFDQAVSDYCAAEADYQTGAKQYQRIRYTQEYYANKAKYESDYWRRYEASDHAYSALRLLCDLVGLDVLSVLRVYKSIRRNSQYQHGWEREAHFSSDRYFEFEPKKAGSIESFCDLCKAQ